jgi:hypothetical protein
MSGREDARSAGMLVTMTTEELRAMLRDVVNAELAAMRKAPALLDRRAMAEALGVSPAQVDWLRTVKGMPSVAVGKKAPRYNLAKCLQWLEENDVSRVA